MKIDPNNIVDVAVGIVTNSDGKVLLGQRPAGKDYAGWWEFPGGKLEAGESVHEALARELSEELDLQINQSTPWLVREHVYEHAHVRLHFRRVIDFDRVPRSQEGQAFTWCDPANVLVEPLLPATVPLMRLLALPKHYAISCAQRLGEQVFLSRLSELLADGLQLVQLREPAMDGQQFDHLFTQVLKQCRDSNALLLVNSVHPEQYWARADGVHWRSKELASLKPVSSAQIRKYPWTGASCHNAQELVQAGAAGVDFAVLGPVQKTQSHPDATPMGWKRFTQLVGGSPLPVYALGGLGPADVQHAVRFGAQGIGMIQGVFGD